MANTLYPPSVIFDAGLIDDGNLGVARMPLGGNWSLSSNLDIASHLLVVDNTNDRIGINTETPSKDLEVNGEITATKVYNAVYNDIADFVEIPDGMEVDFGKCYVRKADSSIALSSEIAEIGVLGLASDTFGYGLGEKEDKNQLPLAIGGFVLACVDKVYAPGTPLTCGADGCLTEMPQETKVAYPERIVAVFDREEAEEIWYDVPVNGRCWVKVKG